MSSGKPEGRLSSTASEDIVDVGGLCPGAPCRLELQIKRGEDGKDRFQLRCRIACLDQRYGLLPQSGILAQLRLVQARLLAGSLDYGTDLFRCSCKFQHARIMVWIR